MVIVKVIAFIYFLAPLISISTILLEKIYVKKINKVKVKKYVDIYVLLPALKEQKIVKETIDWFSNIKYKGKIKYVIITTEKEEEEYRKKGLEELTTNSMVNEYLKIKKDKRFMHLHYPEIKGNKSSQMNYAVNILSKNIKDKKNTYISVFDFDSQPNLDVFEQLNKVAAYKNNPQVIQQVPMNIKNYVQTSKKSVLMTMYALQHLVRSIAIEKYKLLLCSLTKVKIPQYLMGACMHIRLDTLLKNDLFPIFVDDLTLGYRYSIKGYNFSYLPSYNFSLIPNDLTGYFGSATLIFKGILTYLSEIKNTKGNIFRKFNMLLFGTFNILEFSFIPFMYLVFYLYTILTNNYNIIFMIMLLTPILFSLSSYIVLKSYKIKKDNKCISLLAILLSPFWFIFRPVGSFKYLIKKFASTFFKKELEFAKTKR